VALLYRQTVAGGSSNRSAACPNSRVAADWSKPINSTSEDALPASVGGEGDEPEGFGSVVANFSSSVAGTGLPVGGGVGLRAGRGIVWDRGSIS
jgi:hypothetical protein